VPALTNVSLLLLLILFIFSVLGMNFFGEAETNLPGVYGLYNEHANFRYFHTSFITLFRMSTGESWCGVQRDLIDQGYENAWVFFLAYMVIVSSLMFNLLIAIVLDEFGAMMDREASAIPQEAFDSYYAEWSVYDPRAKHFIPGTSLLGLLQRVEAPLGIAGGRAAALKAVGQMTIPATSSGEVHFFDVLLALIKHSFVTRRFGGKYEVANREMSLQTLDAAVSQEILLKFPSLAKQKDANTSSAETLAASLLQSKIRGFKARKEKDRRDAMLRGLRGDLPEAAQGGASKRRK
jgi:hypothetical protein